MASPLCGVRDMKVSLRRAVFERRAHQAVVGGAGLLVVVGIEVVVANFHALERPQPLAAVGADKLLLPHEGATFMRFFWFLCANSN